MLAGVIIQPRDENLLCGGDRTAHKMETQAGSSDGRQSFGSTAISSRALRGGHNSMAMQKVPAAIASCTPSSLSLSKSAFSENATTLLGDTSLSLSSKSLLQNSLLARAEATGRYLKQSVYSSAAIDQQKPVLHDSASISHKQDLKSLVHPDDLQRQSINTLTTNPTLTTCIPSGSGTLKGIVPETKPKKSLILNPQLSTSLQSAPTVLQNDLLQKSATRPLACAVANAALQSTVMSAPLNSSLLVSRSAADREKRNDVASVYTHLQRGLLSTYTPPTTKCSNLTSTAQLVAVRIPASASILENTSLMPTGRMSPSVLHCHTEPGLASTTANGKKEAVASATTKKQRTVDSERKPDKSDQPEYHFELDGLESANDVGYYAYALPRSESSDSPRTVPSDEENFKRELVNSVSASLLRAPNFKLAKDETRLKLAHLCKNVAEFDPEFVLKLALYTRTELNIRTTANFLLAYAGFDAHCRPYIARYFTAAVQLPSDWIEVAEIYQAFHDEHLSFGSLPVALRKAMIAKFKGFDEYQLAKYNKEKSRLKKQKLAKGKSKKQPEGAHQPEGGHSLDTDPSQSAAEEDTGAMTDDENAVTGADYVADQKMFTLKQLIRQLHICEPVYGVMCLLGKKYPPSLEEFYKSRLPGTWDEAKSGKRMKLATPETWETQVSLKGNKAAVWQELIDHKKLPFMAMLRNLRNMLLAGISEKHHQWVINKLTGETSVINSKQFPFRFFSAYEVLNDLQKDYDGLEQKREQYVAQCIKLSETDGKIKSAGSRARDRTKALSSRGVANANVRRLEKVISRTTNYNPDLLQRYRNALDTAVKISTVHNVDPIEGRTLVLCKIGSSMFRPCTAAKGLGPPRQVVEVAILLALMCKYSCELCTMVAYTNSSHITVELEKGTILKNVESVLAYAKIFHEDTRATRDNKSGHSQIADILNEHLVNHVLLDNLIILWDGKNIRDIHVVSNFLRKYRHLVNRDVLQVVINLADKSQGVVSSQCTGHPNDVYLSGYSDQLLRFIAKRADGQGQIEHIETIDKRHKLAEVEPAMLRKSAAEKSSTHPLPAPERPLKIPSLKPRWRSAKVFISSTFRDMHGERDLLTRFIIPEIRARAAKHYINVFDIDLRWGVTEEATRSERMLEICLSEASKCQFFVGLLGERYGWRPSHYKLPPGPLSDWLHTLPPGLSVTELETRLALRGSKERTFFFFRDKSFMKSVPKKYHGDFFPEDDEARSHMAALKNRIRNSKFEIFDGYPCTWIGAVRNLPMTGGLDELGRRIMGQLWTSIKESFPDSEVLIDEFHHEAASHEAVADRYCLRFTGRAELLKTCINTLRKACIASVPAGKNPEAAVGPVIVLSGPAGCGLSSIMAKFARQSLAAEGDIMSVPHVLLHFVGVTPGSTNIGVILRRFCHELAAELSKGDKEPEDLRGLVSNFHNYLMDMASRAPQSPLAVFIDGLDKLDDAHMERSLAWIPQAIPKNVAIIVSAHDGTLMHTHLQRLKHSDNRRNIHYVSVPPLDLSDKKQMVKANLASYGKVLSESPFNNQLQALTSKKDAGNAIYLSIACEELRLHGGFEKVTEKLRVMPQFLPSLIQDVLLRLENDVGDQGILGAALCFLVCARDGISEADLLSSLSYWCMFRDMASTTGLKTIRNVYLGGDDYLPASKFARVTTALQAILKPIESCRSDLPHYLLDHPVVVDAVKERYKLLSAGGNVFQRFLAGHFWNVADCDRDGSWRGRSSAAFIELPYLLAGGGCHDELRAVLTDLQYLKARCSLGLSTSLLQDYCLLETSPQPGQKSIAQQQGTSSADNRHHSVAAFEDYKSFVSRNIHIFSRSPAAINQLALNEPAVSAVAMHAEQLLIGTREGCLNKQAAMASHGRLPTESGIIQWLSKPRMEGACFRTIGSNHASCASSSSSTAGTTVSALAISQSGRLLATGDHGCLVHLYDLVTGEEVQTFAGHSGYITKLCFVASSRLCSASADGTLSLWNVEGGYRINVMDGHSRPVSSCVADSSGKVVASVGRDCCIKLWNGHSGKFISLLIRDQCPLNSVSFHPDGQRVAVGCWDASIKIWDTFSKVRKAVIRGHRSSVRDIAYSPDGVYIASASLDGEVKLWAAEKGVQVGNFVGHRLYVTSLTFSTSGLNLYTAGADHKVKVWSAPLGLLVAHYTLSAKGSATAVTIDPTGTYLLSGYNDGTLAVYDLAAEAVTAVRRVHNGAVRWICTCPSSGNGECFVFVTCSEDGVLMSSAIQRDDPDDSWQTKHFALETPAGTGSLLSIACAHVLLASTGSDSRVRLHLWQQPDLEPLHIFGHIGAVTCCDFNSSATRLATGSRDCSVIIWNTEAASRLCGEDVRALWKSTITSQLHVIRGSHGDWVNDLAWSSDDRFLVTASNDFNLKLWEMTTYKEQQLFKGHKAAVTTVDYANSCIVSGSSDGQVKVWSHRGSEVTTLYVDGSARVNSCAMLLVRKARSKHLTQLPNDEEEQSMGCLHADADDSQIDDDGIRLHTELQGWAARVELSDWLAVHESLLPAAAASGRKKASTSRPIASLADVQNDQLLVCCGSDDGSVRLWRPLVGHQLDTYEGHSDRIVALACCPTSHQPAGRNMVCYSSSLDGSVKQWGRRVGGHSSPVATAAGPWGPVPQEHYGELVFCITQDSPAFAVTASREDSMMCLWLYENDAFAYCSKVTLAMPPACACFVGHNRFVTSLVNGDAASLLTWRIRFSACSNKYLMALESKHACFSPISALVSSHESILYAGQWSGQLTCFSVGDGAIRSIKSCGLDEVKPGAPSQKSDKWPRRIIALGGHDTLLVLGSENLMVTVTSPVQQAAVGQVVFDPARYTDIFGQLAWFTAAAVVGRDVWIGDSNGQLTLTELDNMTADLPRSVKKIHGASVTAVVTFGNKVLTSSLDMTVKVWTEDMVQIGEHHCGSPVTVLEVVSGSDGTFIVGDRMGAVNILRWHDLTY